jgi:phenylpropionate dioxygenase-like ring-hydroxylating dioxygenase large terminal subunit
MTATIGKEADSTAGMRDFRPGSYALRNTWIPLVHTARVHRRPVRRLMHGEPVFVWRDRGALRATEDSPFDIERGRRRASDFTNGSGDYPLVERYGYAWVWYGDPADASADLVPNVPHIPVEGMPIYMQGSVVFDCSYELVCENLLDLTHADYLHSDLTGDPLGEDDQVTVESTSETVTMVRTARDRPISKLQRMWVSKDVEVQDVRLTTLVHVRSGVCILHGNFDPGLSVRMLHPANPETSTRCRTTVTYNPKGEPAWALKAFPLATHMVGRQDNWALREQNKFYVQGNDMKDLNSRFDRAAVRYRKVFQDLVNRQMHGDVSYADDGHPSRDVYEEMGLHLRD